MCKDLRKASELGSICGKWGKQSGEEDWKIKLCSTYGLRWEARALKAEWGFLWIIKAGCASMTGNKSHGNEV